MSAVEWLYPGGHLDTSVTILCSTNESVDTWNAIAQGMNPSEEHILRSKDSFSEVDDINGHLKKMLSGTLLNGFRKNGVPNHELTLKVGDVSLVTRAIHGLGLAADGSDATTASTTALDRSVDGSDAPPASTTALGLPANGSDLPEEGDAMDAGSIGNEVGPIGDGATAAFSIPPV